MKSALRLVEGFGARKRSQWAPFVASAGIVTVPESEPSAPMPFGHCPMISESSSLTVSCRPAGKPVTRKDTLPPAATCEPAVIVADVLALPPEPSGEGDPPEPDVPPVPPEAPPVPESVPPPVLPPVPEPPLPPEPDAVTEMSALRLVEGFGARKRSQWAPAGVDLGTVTVAVSVPSAFTAEGHWPMMPSSSSLTVTLWPLVNPERVKVTFPPAVTLEPVSRTAGSAVGGAVVGGAVGVGVGVGGGVGAGEPPVTVRFSLRTLVCGARNRSQCPLPGVASAGTVTVPETLPSSPMGNCLSRAPSSNLTLRVAPAGKPEASNGTEPPGFTVAVPRVTVGATASATRATVPVASAPMGPAVTGGTANAPMPSVAPAASAAIRPNRGRGRADADVGMREGLAGFMVSCSWRAVKKGEAEGAMANGRL